MWVLDTKREWRKMRWVYADGELPYLNDVGLIGVMEFCMVTAVGEYVCLVCEIV